MLSDLRRIRDRQPDAPAVRSMTPRGEPVVTTWAELCEAVEAWAGHRTGDGEPVVAVVDGTAPSIAAMVGLVGTGRDVFLLEERSSYVDSERAVGASTVVTPPYRSEPRGRVAEQPGRVLQLTSGSTGQPRIAVQPLANVLQGAEAYRRLFELTGTDTILVAVPVVHSYGLAGMFAALLSGATLVTLPRFSIRSLLAGLDGGATVLLGTPLLYRLLAPVLTARRSSCFLRIAVSAGGPLTEDVSAEIATGLGTPIRQIYGITEAGLVACVPGAVTSWPAGSVGLAAPGVMLRIENGRLFVRTPALFHGYWGNAGTGLTEDGFYDTGDLVRVDAAGHLFVLGRKDSFINVGGRKVNPQRIEHVLADHPGVREAFVFGADRPDGEQEVRAAIVLDPDTGVDDVLEFCRSRALMPYEVPHHVHVLDRLPRGGMGKVDRQQVLAATKE